MQRGEHQMTGFRRGQRDRDGLLIAHFADHDHVRILPECGAQRRRKRRRVFAHFPLRDQALAMAVQILHRVFNGEYMVVVIPVDDVQQTRERGGLAAAGRAGQQYQPGSPSSENSGMASGNMRTAMAYVPRCL